MVDIWNSGDLAIVLGLGYPGANRSHLNLSLYGKQVEMEKEG